MRFSYGLPLGKLFYIKSWQNRPQVLLPHNLYVDFVHMKRHGLWNLNCAKIRCLSNHFSATGLNSNLHQSKCDDKSSKDGNVSDVCIKHEPAVFVTCEHQNTAVECDDSKRQYDLTCGGDISNRASRSGQCCDSVVQIKDEQNLHNNREPFKSDSMELCGTYFDEQAKIHTTNGQYAVEMKYVPNVSETSTSSKHRNYSDIVEKDSKVLSKFYLESNGMLGRGQEVGIHTTVISFNETHRDDFENEGKDHPGKSNHRFDIEDDYAVYIKYEPKMSDTKGFGHTDVDTMLIDNLGGRSREEPTSTPLHVGHQVDKNEQIQQISAKNEIRGRCSVPCENENSNKSLFSVQDAPASDCLTDNICQRDSNDFKSVSTQTSHASRKMSATSPRAAEDPYECEFNTKIYYNYTKQQKLKHAGEKLYTCDTCTYSTTYQTSIIRHRMRHTGAKPYTCDVCGFVCRSPQYLKHHKMKHTGEEPYTCDTCTFSTRFPHHLKQHKLKHTGEKPYKCDICTYSTIYSSSLKQHKIKHTREKSFTCSQCEYKTNRSTNLKQHQLMHLREKLYTCDICTYSTPSNLLLSKHLMKHKDKPFQCDECGYGTDTSYKLKIHKMTHSGDKPFKCDTCGYRTRTAYYLQQHKMKHTGEKPYTCDSCSYSARFKHQLKQHKFCHRGDKSDTYADEDTLEERLYTCDTCTYSTTSNNLLSKHKTTHKEKPFQCAECDYRTDKSYKLKIHKMIHTGEKPFMCDTCGYRTRTAYYLQKHKMKHTGEKPYTCDSCSYSTRFKQQLKKHKRLYHNNECISN